MSGSFRSDIEAAAARYVVRLKESRPAFYHDHLMDFACEVIVLERARAAQAFGEALSASNVAAEEPSRKFEFLKDFRDRLDQLTKGEQDR